MLDYSVILKRKYGLDVVQIIIFLKKTESEVVFQDEYRDETTIHKYRIIRLWEEDTELFLQQPILYPFAVLGKSESPEVLLEKVATKIDDIDNELKSELMACTYILAGLKLEKRLIKSLLKEEIMRDSVTYQEIVQEAEIKGEIRGKIQGEIQGKRQEALTLLEKMIKSKLELFDVNLFRQIENLTLEKMEDLAIALLTMDYLGDLELWLEDNA